MYYNSDDICALQEAKEVYSQLRQENITYKKYKNKIKSIMRKHGCKCNNDGISTDFLYMNINNKKYYAQFFMSGNYTLEFIINPDIIDFKQENAKSINEIREAQAFEKCIIKYLHSMPDGNFLDYEE